MLKRLTDAEWRVLTKLASQSKMDCWFLLQTDIRQGCDYVYDREEKTRLTLSSGIALFNEGLSDLADYNLKPEEVKTYRNLITKIEMEDR